MKAKLLLIPAMLLLSTFTGVKSFSPANALDHNELMPYIEIGETDYIQGADDAEFKNGIPFKHGALDYGIYVYISNQNFYNTSTNPNMNPYTTYTDTLVFLNFVVYKAGSPDANAWTFRLNNELGVALLTTEWQTLRSFEIRISRYQSTNYFTAHYEYRYHSLGIGHEVVGWDDIPITGVNQPQTIFGGGLSGITITDSINFISNTQFYGYTEHELNNEYWRGYTNGWNSGNSEGYASGYSSGYNSGLNENDPYGKGYEDGSNDSFLAGIQNWIVPAIIITLIGGGIFSIIQLKRKE